MHTSSSRALNLFAMLTRPTAALQLRSSTRRLPKHICLQDWRRQALHNRFKLVTGTRLGIHRHERPTLVWHSRVPSPLRLLANFAPHGACGHPWKILLAAGSGQETEEMHLPTHVLRHSYFPSTAALSKISATVSRCFSFTRAGKLCHLSRCMETAKIHSTSTALRIAATVRGCLLVQSRQERTLPRCCSETCTLLWEATSHPPSLLGVSIPQPSQLKRNHVKSRKGTS